MDTPALPDNMYKTAQKGISAVMDGLAKCDKAEQIGEDCSEERAKFNYLLQKFNKVKQEYFPNKP